MLFITDTINLLMQLTLTLDNDTCTYTVMLHLICKMLPMSTGKYKVEFGRPLFHTFKLSKSDDQLT